MENNEIINQYRSDNNKITFFRNLSTDDRKKLYQTMTTTERDEFLNRIIPSLYLKDFIFTLDPSYQKDLMGRLSDNQIKTIYNNFDTVDKEKLASLLDERQKELIQQLNDQRNSILRSTNNITRAEENIQNSAIGITNAKIELQTQKQNLKQNAVKFKKLEKERKKRLKKLLRISKSSPLDRIGIFSKRRINRLKEATQNLEMTNASIDELRNYNAEVNQNIEKYQNIIQQEKQNIIEAKEQIIASKQTIHENATAMKNTQKNIKTLSKEEKRILGKKLYGKKVYERDAIMTRKKNIIEKDTTSLENTSQKHSTMIQDVPKQQAIKNNTPKVAQASVKNDNTNQNNTQKSINDISNSIHTLNQMGANLFPPVMGNFSPIQPADLQENPQFTLTQQQLLIATYSIMAVFQYMMRLQQQMGQAQSQNLEASYQNQLSKGSRGIVNLPLLLSLILFIFSLVLFFIK